MEFFKKNITPILITIVFGVVVSLLGTLYAQQNKKIDEKADKAEVYQVVEKLEAIREDALEDYKEERAEQKQLNKELTKSLYQLNTQILLLNEKLKKEKGE